MDIMRDFLEASRAPVAALCQRFGVQRLDVFGSVQTDAFNAEKSDLDFLVEFDADSSRLFDRYFGLKEALEAHFGRKVDLVTGGALRNPYFIEAVNKTRETLYAAEDAQAA